MMHPNHVMTVLITLSLIPCQMIGLQAQDRAKPAIEGSERQDSKQQEKKSPAGDSPAAPLRKIDVRGTCIDEDDKPLANARVLIIRRSESSDPHVLVGETKSNERGRFDLKDVETTMRKNPDLVAVVALQGYVSTTFSIVIHEPGIVDKEIVLRSNPGTVSGVVTDTEGRPIPGVTVFFPTTMSEPLPGIRSAVTDELGRYAISDLQRWNENGEISGQVGFFYLQHPDYAKTRAKNTAVSQQVDVTLYPPAVVEGQVFDAVTNQPAARVTVSAQGVGRRGWFQTKTAANGHYRLLMTQDHYNIWADAEDRIAIAIKARKFENGQTTTGADIRLVRGAFISGTVLGIDGEPVTPSENFPSRIAHYGPARPRTGAAVSSTLIQPDGTYRLRVAPGLNYVYSMTGGGGGIEFEAEDGEEYLFDFDVREKRTGPVTLSDDVLLGNEIRKAAQEEDEELEKRQRRQ